MENSTEVMNVRTISASFMPRDVTDQRRQQVKHRVVGTIYTPVIVLLMAASTDSFRTSALRRKRTCPLQ